LETQIYFQAVQFQMQLLRQLYLEDIILKTD